MASLQEERVDNHVVDQSGEREERSEQIRRPRQNRERAEHQEQGEFDRRVAADLARHGRAGRCADH